MEQKQWSKLKKKKHLNSSLEKFNSANKNALPIFMWIETDQYLDAALQTL